MTSDPQMKIARLNRFRLMMKRMTWLSLIAALIAVAAVASGDAHPRIHVLIATAIGVFGTMLLGTFLMTLSFFSAASGHDADASQAPEQKD